MHLIEENEDMRVLAVGDDDQNIFTFRGADSIYMEKFITEKKAKKYELFDNYRSKSNLVSFSNQFVKTINHRLKTLPIVAYDKGNGIIKTVKYHSNNLIVPTVNDIISTDLSGTTCILTQTNKEALNITGLLIKNGFKAKLIQTNDGFNLYQSFRSSLLPGNYLSQWMIHRQSVMRTGQEVKRSYSENLPIAQNWKSAETL